MGIRSRRGTDVSVTETVGGTVVRARKNPTRTIAVTVAVGLAVYVDERFFHLIHKALGTAGLVLVWMGFIALVAWTIVKTKNWVEDRRWAARLEREEERR